ncbi:SRPBCC family protein [Gimesia algae]|uniref:Polyketide cyclase / dehydrase and lipid transport n=1 Tax=Gimesia algae TaxID=2527971 RepID=A0A517VBQ8_9PLAN|nr:SRPBCC family protein [Gimesia algae]QDT90426.1 Polyketide cyclase / dehydrase and lipid transport [Gimesia algae]
MEIAHHQEIIAPVEVVFSYLNDDEKMKLWMQGLESIEYPKGKKPGYKVGAKFIHTIKEGLNTQRYKGIVTVYEPPTLLAVKLAHPAHRIEVTYELTSLGRKTKLDYHCELEFASFYYRCMGLLFSWFTKRILKSQVAKLKELAEQESVRRAPPVK